MRNTVFDIVYGTLEKGVHSDELFHRSVEEKSGACVLTKQEKSFVRRISYGTIERVIELDRVIDHFSRTPVRKMKPVIRTILRMGVYELLYMDSVPESATCNEMVKLAKKRKFQSLSGFVNGVLRNVARADKENLRKELLEQCLTEKEKLSFLYSMPLELVEMLTDTYGAKTAERMFASFYEDNPVTIRVQTMNADVGQVREELEKAGICVAPCENHEQAFHLRGVDQIDRLPGFAEGHFTVQDERSLLPVMVSGIKPGDRVADVCSSPGGKALYAVDRLRGQGMVSARDVSGQKVQKIKENAERLRADNLEIKVWDGAVPDDAWFEKADVVLADVPCSGIGVIGRKPEIRYTALQNAKELQKLQRSIVTGAVSMLKPGGILVYSTCTVNPAENEENAKWIEENLPLTLVSLDEFLPESLKNSMTARGMLQILPGIQKGDGFFVAKFRKQKPEHG